MAAITSAIVGVAGSIYAAKQAKSQAKEQNTIAREGIEAADPYKAYRGDAAVKLNALMSDPSAIQDTAEYKSRIQAAQRQLAAQGYTGSGNALVEAAEAGGGAYQQAFSNLAMLSGANQQPGQGYANASQAMADGNSTKNSATAGIVNNLSNLIMTAGGGFNKAAKPGGG